MKHISRPVSLIGIVAGAGLLLAACGGTAETDDNPPAETDGPTTSPDVEASGDGSPTDAACAAAAGGTTRHWATTDAEVFKEMIKPFTEKYPDVTVEYASYRPNDAIQQILVQQQTGRALDVDSVAMSLPYVGPLLEEDLVGETDWSALGIADDKILQIDDDISLYRNYRMFSGLVFNADLVDAAELPDTWADLVDERWRGQVVVDPRGTYLSRLAVAWGEDQTVSWYEDLMATAEPLVVQGATASLQKVTSGEALISTSAHDSEVLEQQATGAPLEIKYLDVVPTQDYYSFILKNTENRAAAECFLSWYASDEGMEQQLTYEYKGNASEPDVLPAGSSLANQVSIDDATLVADVGAELSAMTGGEAG